ncbi:MAG TPA: ATP-binding cassette domain-containing protein, partial [Bacteroidia bacterium]|nr:ATP-binding cassette domain-containing protein [Bacteroidia bacterium]
MHTLEADSISLHFGLKKILSNVYINCQTGSITGLLGRNGEGKTCLLNIIYGTLQATSKSIRFNNTVVSSPYKNPSLLMYLPQFNFIPKSLSLKQIFNHYNINFNEFQNHFPELNTKYNTSIKQLSGGHTRLIEL